MNPTDKYYSRYFTYIKPIFRIPLIKSYALPIINIMVMAIFILFAIKPTVETITVLQKKITDSQTTLDQITKKSEDLVLGKQNLDNMDSTTRTKIDNAVPVSADLRSVIRSLEQSANTNQATISGLQFQPLVLESTTGPKELAEIQFTYNVEASYETLLNILDDLNTSPRLISIESLILNELPESSTILMSVTGKAYFLK